MSLQLHFFIRQAKEIWIKAKYVEKKFLKRLGSVEVENDRKSSQRWSVKKCQRNNSSIKAPSARRKYRHDGGNTSPAMLSSGMALTGQSFSSFILSYILQ